MLSNTLVTNEVKNSAGTEVEFERLSTEGRTTVFAQKSENPALEHRLKISHQETGSGINRRRRSMVRFDKAVASTVDTTKTVNVGGYIVLDAPIGALGTNAEFVNVLAELLSFCATTGAATTVLFDGTGNGATALISGGL